MRFHITGTSNEILGTTDITGQHWISVHNGFYNANAVHVTLEVKGRPISMVFEDYLGQRYVIGPVICSVEKCYPGMEMIFPPEAIHLDFGYPEKAG